VTVEIIECPQGSEEWFRARMGMPTASMFADILASGKGGGESKMRRTYLMKLAGEILTGEPMDNYSNAHMERGKAMEGEARNFYSFMHDAEPKQIGFIRNGSKGCSPDSLIGDSGVLEIKTALPHILIDKLCRADTFPSEHYAQTQGELWVSEREWVDLAIYWPRLPLFVKRAHRDEKFIAKLAEAVDRFNDELAATVQHIRSYGNPDGLRDALSASLEGETAPYGRDKGGRAMNPLEAL
jgi:hypothetical protein